MLNFIKNQYERKRIDANKVRSFVPKWITEAQADSILKESLDV